MAWVKGLIFFVDGVLAMLGDQQNGINRQAGAAPAERFLDRVEDWDAVTFGNANSEVGFGRGLLDINRADFKIVRRLVKRILRIVKWESVEKTPDNMIRMLQIMII